MTRTALTAPVGRVNSDAAIAFYAAVKMVAAPAGRPAYENRKAMTAYYNEMCARALALGITAYRPRGTFTFPYSLNKISALEALLANAAPRAAEIAPAALGLGF